MNIFWRERKCQSCNNKIKFNPRFLQLLLACWGAGIFSVIILRSIFSNYNQNVDKIFLIFAVVPFLVGKNMFSEEQDKVENS